MRENVRYYDITFYIDGEMLDLDRIYVFDDDSFTKADYAALDAIYKQLPGYINDDGWPFWFGTDCEGIYLSVSWEPPGLQLSGYLPLKDFMEWEARLHELLRESGLPFKKE